MHSANTVGLVIAILSLAFVFSLNSGGDEAPEIEDVEVLEQIAIPVYVHLVDDGTRQYSTSRDSSNIFRLFEDVNRIWSPANISFIVEKIDRAEFSNIGFRSVFNGNVTPIVRHSGFVGGEVNAYFARAIDMNGISFPPQGFFIVGDITSVNDFRTTAHEVGHLLGLQHIRNRSYLMYQGSNGESLTNREIDTARRNGERVYTN